MTEKDLDYDVFLSHARTGGAGVGGAAQGGWAAGLAKKDDSELRNRLGALDPAGY